MDFDNPPDRLFGSEVAIWLDRMGFNGKQVSAAAERMGLSGRQLMRKRDGEAELTLQDRLAMAALRAGIPPWSPETDQTLADLMDLKTAVDKIASRR